MVWARLLSIYCIGRVGGPLAGSDADSCIVRRRTTPDGSTREWLERRASRRCWTWTQRPTTIAQAKVEVFERARDTVVPALMRTFGRVEIEVPRDSLVESDGARPGPMSQVPNGTLAAAQPSTQ